MACPVCAVIQSSDRARSTVTARGTAKGCKSIILFLPFPFRLFLFLPAPKNHDVDA